MKKPFERAVSDHGATVLRVCRAVLGVGADADDAWSETFLSALRAWPELPNDTNVEAWLVRVAQRKAVDIIRARQRHAVPVALVPDRDDASAAHTGDRVGVWDVVALLPDRQRLAIAYHYLGGLPHAETAKLLGSTPEAVRRAAADGMKTLRRMLADTPRE
ncbi:RNA polymerase sigma factor [Gordonia aichiensis]|uniref:Putative RNA polymerase ECF-type sigma factor n=1 Tax=Gordonia aichiensis NBRC 108223 TaxID=1220583 RepID=L7KIU0_9ACTN|nr:sigma-70 family RNA polymerase sigma factor [Gordonia aichiensis]GAC48499.1 putative RNA polymerase ECF-type sigma factor [Gordonia aichiensis NBRC 108223]